MKIKILNIALLLGLTLSLNFKTETSQVPNTNKIYVCELSEKNKQSTDKLGTPNIDTLNPIIFGPSIKYESPGLRNNLFYLKAISQENGWACGYWSLANAKAIQDLIKPNISNAGIDASLISSISSDIFYDRLKPKENNLLDTTEMIKLAKDIKLENVHVLREPIGLGVLPDYDDPILQDPNYQALNTIFVDDLQVPLNNPDSVTPEDVLNSEFLRDQYFNIVNKKILNTDPNSTVAVNFICNLSSTHWILITVLKFPNKAPVMVMLDSLNTEILNTRIVNYLEVIYKYFIEEYQNKISNEEQETPLEDIIEASKALKFWGL